MTSRDFCFWLQGYLELATEAAPQQAMHPAQVACVQRHLALVFRHEIDPSLALLTHKADTLQQIHDGVKFDPTGLQIRC
jgi:hypothetical protein